MIAHEKRLGHTLALIVTGTRTQRIDMPPVILPLRMDDRIAVDLRSRSLHDFSSVTQRQIEHIDRTQHRSLGGLDRIELIKNRGGGTRQIINFIDLRIVRQRDIVLDEPETGIIHQLHDVPLVPRKKIIETDDLVPLAK